MGVKEDFGSAGYGFVSSFLKAKKNDIQTYLVKNQVGFIPEGFDYSDFQEVRKSQIYKRLRILFPNHESLPILLMGLYLAGLDSDERKGQISKLKTKAYQKYKRKGVAILNIAQTGFIQGFVSYFNDLSIKEEMSQEELVDIYEDILNDWEERTFFVKNSNSEKDIRTVIISKCGVGKNLFFVFASYSAICILKKIVDCSDFQATLTQFGYDFKESQLNSCCDELVYIFEKIKI